ncbi:hypothetical protein Tco_0421625 [Tanacetum coccineum]
MHESEPPKKIKKRVQVQMSVDEELAKKVFEEEQARFNAEQEARFKAEQEQERIDFETALELRCVVDMSGGRRKKSLARKRAKETFSEESKLYWNWHRFVRNIFRQASLEVMSLIALGRSETMLEQMEMDEIWRDNQQDGESDKTEKLQINFCLKKLDLSKVKCGYESSGLSILNYTVECDKIASSAVQTRRFDF